MTEKLKMDISEAARSYLISHHLTNEDAATITGISSAYLSLMLRNEMRSGDTEIADKWWLKLASFVGFSADRKSWKTVQTRQMVHMMPAVLYAKETQSAITLVGPTGVGKSYLIDLFAQKKPKHTYRITVSSIHSVWDILNDLSHQLNVELLKSRAARLKKIIIKLREIKLSGGSPLIIIDEAENLELPALKMLKGIYDGLNTYAGIVLIGTPQLLKKIDRMRHLDYAGIPQLYRRLKAGIRMLPNEIDYEPFFIQFGVKDAALKKLITRVCDNYGELHDYLDYALQEAQRLNAPLNEENFRIWHNMPKN
jgi:DNA transposition AAA+ family ATPase